MKNHEQIVELLAQSLMVAARNQVAVGALYSPGEDMAPKDPIIVWRGLAETLVKLVEVAVRDAREVAEHG